jgi:hypothetical protein
MTDDETVSSHVETQLIDRQSTLRCGNVSVLSSESYAIDFEYWRTAVILRMHRSSGITECNFGSTISSSHAPHA